MTRNVLDVDDLSCEDLEAVLALAAVPAETLSSTFSGRGVAIVLEKPSLRTRVSTGLAVAQLGGARGRGTRCRGRDRRTGIARRRGEDSRGLLRGHLRAREKSRDPPEDGRRTRLLTLRGAGHQPPF